jgi:membrane protein DedA with SNARE-associated domain
MKASAQDEALKSAGRLSALSVAILLVLLAIYLTAEGNLTEGFVDLRDWFYWFFRNYGVPGSLGLLYVEESGLPLPVPGDVYVIYLGHLAQGSFLRLVENWLAIIAVVIAGSSNLYLISRRWGPRLIEHPLARLLHVDAERLETAKHWFDRWGVLAVIFGRHIPGFRVPITVVAGTLGFPYRLFVPSVAVSTAIWAGVFLLVGEKLGTAIARFTGRNPWIYAVGTVILLGTFALLALRNRVASAAPAGRERYR